MPFDKSFMLNALFLWNNKHRFVPEGLGFQVKETNDAFIHIQKV